MTALVLEPHNDDSTLFAFWTIMREHPRVMTCFRSYRMGERGYPEPRVDMHTRERESAAAMAIANVAWEQIILPDTLPGAQLHAGLVDVLKNLDFTPSHVYVPTPHDDGHPQHNIVAYAAFEVFQGIPVTLYCTYTNGRERMIGTREVEFDRAWIKYKFLALACFDSQLRHPSISHHFTDHGLREWYA